MYKAIDEKTVASRRRPVASYSAAFSSYITFSFIVSHHERESISKQARRISTHGITLSIVAQSPTKTFIAQGASWGGFPAFLSRVRERRKLRPTTDDWRDNLD